MNRMIIAALGSALILAVVLAVGLAAPAAAHIPEHCEAPLRSVEGLADDWGETKDDLLSLSEDTPDFPTRAVETLLIRNAVAQEMINRLFGALACVERD